MRLPLVLCVAMLLSTASIGHAGTQDVAAVTQQLDTFAQRMHNKQESAILASYTQDAVFIDPSGKQFTTPAQLRKLYDEVFATYDSDLRFGPPTVVLRGHSFHTSGTFTETLRNRRTGVVQGIRGTYRFNLSTFYDGHWAFTRMLWTVTP